MNNEHEVKPSTFWSLLSEKVDANLAVASLALCTHRKTVEVKQLVQTRSSERPVFTDKPNCDWGWFDFVYGITLKFMFSPCAVQLETPNTLQDGLSHGVNACIIKVTGEFITWALALDVTAGHSRLQSGPGPP